LCVPRTSTSVVARWRTALVSTTNLVIGYLRSGWRSVADYRCVTARSDLEHDRLRMKSRLLVIAIAFAVTGATGASSAPPGVQLDADLPV
jgi:hypothetical protein